MSLVTGHLALVTSPMRRCAFLTLEDPTGFVIDDELAYAPLAALGWRVEAIPWSRKVDWRVYDAVVIRSTWVDGKPVYEAK